jgi:hypothetical protein
MTLRSVHPQAKGAICVIVGAFVGSCFSGSIVVHALIAAITAGTLGFILFSKKL